MISIRKPDHVQQILDVCLVLDGNVDDQMCNGSYEVEDPDSEYFTWYKPRKNVRRVELVFRDTNSDQNAEIADLKIFYQTDYIYG